MFCVIRGFVFRSVWLAFAGAAFLLAACAASLQNPSPLETTLGITVESPAAVSLGIPKLEPPRVPTRVDPHSDSLANLQPTLPDVRIAGPWVDLRKRLIGMTPNSIQQIIGTPKFQRRDPPAIIWQYRMPGCLVDVFLYEMGNKLTVRHVATRGRTVFRPPAENCFDELLRRRGSS